VEETLFERVKVILKFRCFHESSSIYYTNGNAEGFIMADLEDAKYLSSSGERDARNPLKILYEGDALPAGE
jgi:hypothetical protein